MPWASRPSVSYLVGPAELRGLLAASGYEERHWSDDTQKCIAWYHALAAARKRGAPPPAGYELLLGADFREKGRNVLRNLKENRIGVVQAIFERRRL